MAQVLICSALWRKSARSTTKRCLHVFMLGSVLLFLASIACTFMHMNILSFLAKRCHLGNILLEKSSFSAYIHTRFSEFIFLGVGVYHAVT